MAPKESKKLSAQVALRSASGKQFDLQTPITSENISEYLPSSDSVVSAQRAFVDAGFDVGNLVGNSFSITAPASQFEKLFKVKIQHDEEAGARVNAGGAEPQYELPVAALPPELKQSVAAITFSPPPDFGPTSY
jgi:hypothetical protein